MEIDNATACETAFTLAMDAEGRQHVVVVAKASFEFPDGDGEMVRHAAVPDPLVMADVFWGEPGFSAPRTEMDFAHVKGRCDVLLEASVHAPGGRPADRVRVGVRLGGWSKVVEAVGDRVWIAGLGAPAISDPVPFTRMPISYDRAFGGVDRLDPRDDPPHAYLPNPVGRGWHRIENARLVTGAPLPNIEAPGRPVAAPWDACPPMSFGPMGRGWPDRLRHAGTYDDAWTDEVFPFLPRDFDPRYYQAAPEDQQIPFPAGGETVTLVNLTPEGRVSFRLPPAEMPVLFVRKRAEDMALKAPLDTVVIRPDARRLTLTWRASVPLRRDIFEVPECILGPRSAAFWRARRLGKNYYPSLGKLVRSRRDEELAE
jgi:hypothetical protein